MMNPSLQDVLKELKSSPLFILFSLFIVLLSSLLTISTSFALIVRFYRRTIGYKRSLYKDLSRLAAGVSIEFFQSILGPHVFKRQKNDMTEYLFANNSFYVQAITNRDDSVAAFFVTTRKGIFHPILILGPYSLNQKSVLAQLGKTRFISLDEKFGCGPSSVFYTIGARRFSYYETWYFGNPGNYQTFIFGFNDAGYGDFFCPGLPIVKQGDISAGDPDVIQFRRRTIMNTYGVTAPLAPDDILNTFWVGADLDRVRVLAGYPVRGWWKLWLLRITVRRNQRRWREFMKSQGTHLKD
jgi:hypothetical protein